MTSPYTSAPDRRSGDVCRTEAPAERKPGVRKQADTAAALRQRWGPARGFRRPALAVCPCARVPVCPSAPSMTEDRLTATASHPRSARPSPPGPTGSSVASLTSRLRFRSVAGSSAGVSGARAKRCRTRLLARRRMGTADAARPRGQRSGTTPAPGRASRAPGPCRAGRAVHHARAGPGEPGAAVTGQGFAVGPLARGQVPTPANQRGDCITPLPWGA